MLLSLSFYLWTRTTVLFSLHRTDRDIAYETTNEPRQHCCLAAVRKLQKVGSDKVWFFNSCIGLPETPLGMGGIFQKNLQTLVWRLLFQVLPSQQYPSINARLCWTLGTGKRKTLIPLPRAHSPVGHWTSQYNEGGGAPGQRKPKTISPEVFLDAFNPGHQDPLSWDTIHSFL